MGEINTIVFDIGNVLVDFRWEEYLRDCNYDEDVIGKVSNATVMNKLWKKWDRGDIDEAEMIEQCCLLEPSVELEIRKFFADILKVVREYNYSADFIQGLKKNNYKVYLLSNYAETHFELDKEYFKFINYVDGGVISYEIGCIKPEAKIYKTLIEKYNINPSEAVFLDDLPENLKGAKPFGFHTIQVKSYEQMLLDLRELGVRV
ncbi:MAG: HAD family phosphatase [Herbinix sp.]|nr:HAD family phosphatase [Herbinix sp.]